MNAPNGSAPPALAPVPMSDSGPLSWVFEELRQCLETADATLQCFVSDNATARGGDLAEVDSSELRLLGQQLHQAVGALELVELSAAARTLRALESAVRQLTQKPALASAEAAAAVSAGCRVLLDYLWRVLRQRPVSSEALLPTYLAWQQLAGAVRIHPADLWDCEPRTAPVPDQAPAPLTPEPALRTRIERHVLAVVKNRDPAAAAALVPLAGALARAATGPEAQQYWLAAAACFEALSGDALTDSVYLKRAVTGVLSQYKAMESGRVEQWARPTHELLYLIARVPLDRQRPDWAYFSAIWRTYAWQLPAAGAQPEQEPLGQRDALSLQQTLAALNAAQQAWERWSAGDSSAAAGLALQRLGTCLDALSPFSSEPAPADRSWSRTWSELAEQLSRDPATWPAGLALEVCSSLLCLGAELDDFDAHDGAWRTRQQDLMERLHRCVLGLPLEHTPLWMVERYRGFSERQSQAALLLQMRGDLTEVERALDDWLSTRQGAPTAMPDGIWSRIDALQKVAEWLDLEPVVATLGAMRRRLWALDTSAESPQSALESTQWLAHNFSALGLMLEALAQQPGRNAAAAFAFDPSTERLQALMPTASAATELPQIGADRPAASADQPPPPQPLEVPAAPAGPESATDEDDLLGVFVAEAQALCEQIEQGMALLQSQPSSAPELLAVRRAFHTLKGSARMVGQAEVGQFAWSMEQVLNVRLADRLPASPDLLLQCGAALQQIRAALGLESPLTTDEPPLAPPARPAEPQGEATLPPRLPPRPEHVPVLREALTLPPVLDQPVKLVGPLRIELDLFNVFLTEADTWSQRLLQGLAALRPTATTIDAEPSQWELLSQQAHALAGGAATVGHEGLAQLARAIEQALERLAAQPSAGKIHASRPTHSVLQAHALLTEAVQQVQGILHQFAAGILRNPSADLLLGLANVAPPAGAANAVLPEAEPASALPALIKAPAAFALDPDLFAVFEDEAQLLLPQLHSALRQWSARPQHSSARSELLRLLHTFKGSARLAGALQLGERLHRLESELLALPEVPQPEALRALQPEFDQIGADLTQLRRSSVKVSAEPAQRPSGHKTTGFWSEAAQPTAVGHTLRVRADWLDRLVLHAADVSRSRTRLEADLLTVRRSFQDMASNVARLRSQLRELELQTETPMSPTGLLSPSTETGFDPLELDRYTRPQELTRLMAEAVNDVVTVQHQLQRAMQSAEGNLAAQTRQTRELQRDLLRSRLVAFDSLAERLQRTVRLAAEDCDKSVELHLQQGELELERGLLERLAPVLEHLLRNAVVHGLETDVQRHQLGKSMPGRIVIALQAHDNDLSITLSDDGAGLDSERIRQRALALGLHSQTQPWSLEDAQRLIFAVGLSTASAVNEVAGRGIGLDAVRNEVLALGGRIDCLAPPEGGCAFRLWLARSSSFSQVLMVRVGEFVFGVPADWVHQVHRVQAEALTAAYASARWSADTGPMPFHWAGALLALSAESTDEQSQLARQWSVLECYSAGQRVAWHVDEVLGQQEVVLKPLGPPLAGLPGLAGATVLTSGAVCLIYNPVALTALCAEAARHWVQQQRTQAAASLAAAASDAASSGAAAAPLVLVVDDSITVRRVTQRLLQREGYRVALAADGVQALQRLAQEIPALLLCDIEMPRMDGFELLQQMRQEPRWADLPVIMITSRLADKHRQHAFALGVKHYLGKPYAEPELLALVQAACRRSP